MDGLSATSALPPSPSGSDSRSGRRSAQRSGRSGHRFIGRPASAGRFTISIWIAPNVVTKFYRVFAQREMRWLLARWLEIANGEIPKCSAASSIRSWV